MNRKLFIGVGALTAIAIAVMVVFVLRAKQEDTTNTNQVQNTSSATDDAAYISIPELGVRVMRSADMADVSYKMQTVEVKGGEPLTYAAFTSTELNDAVKNPQGGQSYQYCDSATGAPLGTISIIQDYPDGDDFPMRANSRVLASGEYVAFNTPQDTCTDNKAVLALFEKKFNAIRDSFETIEAVNGNKLSVVQQGTITGSLGYPSEGIPSEMTVCAELVDKSKSFCQSAHYKGSEYTYGEGFYMTVPVGKYTVYATLKADPRKAATADRAYWNKYVQCGMTVDCNDHTAIVVNVTQGSTTKGVDPQDWY